MSEQFKPDNESAERLNNQEQVERFIQIIEETKLGDWMQVISKINIPNAWLVGGAIRNTVWKRMFPDSDLKVNDVDVPYYSSDLPPEADQKFDKQLKDLYPDAIWECANQAWVHQYSRQGGEWVMPNAPYTSLEHSMTDFWFSVNRIGIRLGQDGHVEILNPEDLNDLFSGVLRVLPNQRDNPHQWFEDKINKITSKCPQIKVIR